MNFFNKKDAKTLKITTSIKVEWLDGDNVIKETNDMLQTKVVSEWENDKGFREQISVICKDVVHFFNRRGLTQDDFKKLEYTTDLVDKMKSFNL